jgi:hypothetical protein
MGQKLDQIKALTVKYVEDVNDAANAYYAKIEPLEQMAKTIKEEAKGAFGEFSDELRRLSKEYLQGIEKVLTGDNEEQAPQPTGTPTA